MDLKQREWIVSLRANSKTPFQITVRGISMKPVLLDGDIITIKQEDNYKKGDILIYSYNNEGILVHRLLKINQKTFICKGDNCYRIESIPKEKIIGKVIQINNINGVKPFSEKYFWKIIICVLSYNIGIQYERSKLIPTGLLYKFYKRIHLERLPEYL